MTKAPGEFEPPKPVARFVAYLNQTGNPETVSKTGLFD
jgi:hypothetical protein